MNRKQPVTGKKAALPEKAVWKPTRSVLVALMAVTVALAILCGVFGGLLIARRAAEKAETASYRYDKIKIKEYLAGFSADMVTGYDNIPGKDVKPTGVDEAAVKEYINSLLLQNAKAVNSGKVSKTGVIGYADAVGLYILEVSLDGERVETEYFENAFEVATLQVGGKVFGEEFDEKLIGLVPTGTGTLTFLTVDPVTKAPLSFGKGDVLTVSYTATIEGEDEAYESWSNLRIDTANPRNKLLCDAILAKSETVPVGQQFGFELTHDVDEDGEEEKVSYLVTVGAIVTEENVKEITFTLPADYFSENQDEEYTDLNGKTLTARIVIEYMVDYTANTWETMTVADMKTEGIGYVAAGATDKERQACIAYVTDKLSKDYDETERETKLALIWQTLLETLEFATLPEDALEEAYDSIYASIVNAFYYQGGSSYYADLNTFGPVYFGYDAEEYGSLADYLNDYMVPNYVKQQLLVYGIYNELVNDKGEKKLKAAYDEWVTTLTEEAGSGATEQQIVDYYGETYIRSLAIGDVVADYLLENNEVNWELSPEIEE